MRMSQGTAHGSAHRFHHRPPQRGLRLVGKKLVTDVARVLLTYPKLARIRTGSLINANQQRLIEGLRRFKL